MIDLRSKKPSYAYDIDDNKYSILRPTERKDLVRMLTTATKVATSANNAEALRKQYEALLKSFKDFTATIKAAMQIWPWMKDRKPLDTFETTKTRADESMGVRAGNVGVGGLGGPEIRTDVVSAPPPIGKGEDKSERPDITTSRQPPIFMDPTQRLKLRVPKKVKELEKAILDGIRGVSSQKPKDESAKMTGINPQVMQDIVLGAIPPGPGRRRHAVPVLARRGEPPRRPRWYKAGLPGRGRCGPRGGGAWPCRPRPLPAGALNPAG